MLSRSSDLKTFTVNRAGRSWVVSVDRLKPAFSHTDLSHAAALAGSSSALADDLPDSLVDFTAEEHAADLPVEPLPRAASPVPAAPAPADVPVADLPPVDDRPPQAVDPVLQTRLGRISRPPERFQAGF